VDRRHFGESLALLRVLEDAGLLRSPAIDIGSGAGFPGVPIKIVRPELRLTLLEATGKKVAFLTLLVEALGLRDVSVVHGRAEEVAHDPAHRERYLLALARAVAPLRVLVELALPFLQIGGVLAAPKGSAARREVEEAATALQACGGEVEAVRPLPLAPKGPVPTLVLVRKVAPSPAHLPRRPGIPAKRPL
jgi:16S rRNA (guanine527-N7)-methyltransferase